MLVASVCDGAGSVPEGRTGADFIARSLTEQLSAALSSSGLDGAALPSGGGLEARLGADLAAPIRAAIETVRGHLAELASSRELSLHDFSCTLVGCAAGPFGGSFFHIGDGFALQQGPEGNCVLSAPENGEFADETYFVTDENWNEHLRLTALAAAEQGTVIGLMSDGTAPFAINRARSGFFRPFIDPVADFLRKSTAADGNEALRNLLESPRASEISTDDKTLLLAFVV